MSEPPSEQPRRHHRRPKKPTTANGDPKGNAAETSPSQKLGPESSSDPGQDPGQAPPQAPDKEADQEPTKDPADSQGNSKKPSRPRHKRYQRKPTQRRLEIDGLRERFKVFGIDPVIFRILLTPSDPDFAFPLPFLDFDLHVSRHYPNQGAPPHITVNNDDIPRGNSANVEKAFQTFEGTLVEKVTKLDTELERLLTLPAARTLTIVRGKPKLKGPLVSQKDPGANVNDTASANVDPETGDHKTDHNNTDANTAEPNPDVTDTSSTAAEKVAEKVGELDVSKDAASVLDVDSNSNSSSESSDYEPEYMHASDEEDVDMGPKTDMAKPTREGTELVFPDIKLTNIALCEIVSLNILFQCGRCKTSHTFSNLQSAEYGKPSKPRAEICSKCDLPLLAAFRKEYLHSTSHTAGYLDVDGGRVIDLLPSSYAAMCGQCQAWSPVFKNVDMGAQRMISCRTCHTKLWIQLELFNFVLLSTETLAPAAKKVERAKLPASLPKQKLNLTGGEPLPNHGACEHYRKSLRWFRFSCCQRVFPCDRCHDNEMQHPSEQASRMLCGYCSREQRFSMKCVYCEHDYTQRVTRFWEGGAGVRDRKLMSRKDKRKYKRDPVEKKKSSTHFQGKSKEAPKHS